MKRIPILWLIEHVAREFDVACAVKAILESRYNVEVVVRNVYLHAREVMDQFQPDVVVHPFFYYVDGALATQDFVRTWPDATHFSMAWEQMFYSAHAQAKAPADDFTRTRVLHHAWGDFYQDFLRNHGVDGNNIFLNGNPAYQLYREPYRQFFAGRRVLAERYEIDPQSRWVFLPENYRWGFLTDRRIANTAKQGADETELLELRDFCRRSLADLLSWCNKTNSPSSPTTIILRPRPATHSDAMNEFIEQHVGALEPHVRLIKGESAREWILASDAVISSYSTCLIEASIAGKPCYMAEPHPLPNGLYLDWYDLVPRLTTEEAFRDACLGSRLLNSGLLSKWASRELLNPVDPIARLAEHVYQLVPVERRSGPSAGTFGWSAITQWLAGSQRRHRPAHIARKYFNQHTHESDVFTPADVQRRTSDWRSVLDAQPQMENIAS